MISNQGDAVLLQEDLDHLKEWEKDWQMAFSQPRQMWAHQDNQNNDRSSSYPIQPMVKYSKKRFKRGALAAPSTVCWPETTTLTWWPRMPTRLSPFSKGICQPAQRISRHPAAKKGEKSPGSATITNRSPSQTPRGRGNRQIQTSTNRTNVRKALRLALSSPSEVIAILKGLKKHKNKITHGTTYNKSPRRINHKATKSKTNTGTTPLERSVEQHTGGLKHFYS